MSSVALRTPNPRIADRVKNPLPEPLSCRYCRSPISIRHHREIYGKAYSDWPYVYSCNCCNSRVGMHQYTYIPVGIMASQELRTMRAFGKKAFEAVKKNRRWRPDQAYQWLADQLEIPVEACHWEWFEEERCAKAGEICRAALQRLKAR